MGLGTGMSRAELSDSKSDCCQTMDAEQAALGEATSDFRLE